MINHFRGQYNWLSNFYPAKVRYGKLVFPTVEHFYVAMKTHNRLIRIQISKMPAEDAGKVKKMGREIEIRDDWEDIKLSVMMYGLREKFYQNTSLGDKLLATGSENIVEGNYWNDTFWGVDLKQNPNIGENHLGRLLMDVRKSLKDFRG
ncbi:MAG: NADAR family protein [Candidatus Riesia sp.]|nr:NADAR family protein [Candidatus Riesia sp.]